jgi:hypothetical protein
MSSHVELCRNFLFTHERGLLAVCNAFMTLRKYILRRLRIYHPCGTTYATALCRGPWQAPCSTLADLQVLRGEVELPPGPPGGGGAPRFAGLADDTYLPFCRVVPRGEGTPRLTAGTPCASQGAASRGRAARHASCGPAVSNLPRAGRRLRGCVCAQRRRAARTCAHGRRAQRLFRSGQQQCPPPAARPSSV